MAEYQARLKPEHRILYPGINALTWYDVAPLFPGVRDRMVNMSGERIARIRTPREYLTIPSRHLEFRPAERADRERAS